MSARPGPPRLRSLRDKLTLLFFAVTAGAFAVLYFVVVPELESNLREQKLEDIARVAAGSRVQLDTLTRNPNVTAESQDRRVRSIADAADARVTLYGVQLSVGEGASDFYVVTDSRE